MTDLLDSAVVILVGLVVLATAGLVAWAGVLAVRRGVERVVLWIQVRRFAWWRR